MSILIQFLIDWRHMQIHNPSLFLIAHTRNESFIYDHDHWYTLHWSIIYEFKTNTHRQTYIHNIKLVMRVLLLYNSCTVTWPRRLVAFVQVLVLIYIYLYTRPRTHHIKQQLIHHMRTHLTLLTLRFTRVSPVQNSACWRTRSQLHPMLWRSKSRR